MIQKKIFTKLKVINETEVLNFKFENKKDFYVTSKNSLAFDLIQNWPKWNNQIFFFYMDRLNVVKQQYVKYGRKNLRPYF